MKTSDALNQLVDELRFEIDRLKANPGAYLLIVNEDDDSEIRMEGENAALLLHSTSTIEQMMDLLDCPEDCTIDIHAIRISAEAESLLNRRFLAVNIL